MDAAMDPDIGNALNLNSLKKIIFYHIQNVMTLLESFLK